MGPGIDPETLGSGKKKKGQNLLFKPVQDLVGELGKLYVAQCPDVGLFIINGNKATGNAAAVSRPNVQTATNPLGWLCGLQFVQRSAWQAQEKCHEQDKSANPKRRLHRKRFDRAVRA